MTIVLAPVETPIDESELDPINRKWVELLKHGIKVIMLSHSRYSLLETRFWNRVDVPQNSLAPAKGILPGFEPGEQNYPFIYLSGWEIDGTGRWAFIHTCQNFVEDLFVHTERILDVQLLLDRLAAGSGPEGLREMHPSDSWWKIDAAVELFRKLMPDQAIK